MFCLGGIACDDDGEMFSLMVRFHSTKNYTQIFSYILAE